MPPSIEGLHHVTATVGDAQEDLDFYVGLLGLRLVKKTVNFDHHGVYHFYYGDQEGTPSTLMTTFPYRGQGVRVGQKGAGQITLTSFSVPEGSLPWWHRRLSGKGLRVRETPPRFGHGSLVVEDPSGLAIELAEAPGDERTPWVAGDMEAEAAIRGIHSVTLRVRNAGPSAGFLVDALGATLDGVEGPHTRMAVGKGGSGAFLEILEDPLAPDAVNGLGTVHHVALAVADGERQLQFREALVDRGVQVTPVRDRQYFTSIYFREPGGILYEIATLGPGFTLDEEVAALGTGLKVPVWEEVNRPAIEAALPPVTLPTPSGG
jgi:glyoxalase family protein